MITGAGITPKAFSCNNPNAGGANPSPSPYAKGIPTPFDQNLAKPLAIFILASVTIKA